MTDVAKWNSLTHIELIVGLEELFGIQFTQDEVVKMTSVGAIRDVLNGMASRGLSDRRPSLWLQI